MIKLEFCLANGKYYGARWEKTELFSFLGISEVTVWVTYLLHYSQRVMHFPNNKLTGLSSFSFWFPMCLLEDLFCQYAKAEEINCLRIPEVALHCNQSHCQNMFVHWKTCFTSGFSLYLGETLLCQSTKTSSRSCWNQKLKLLLIFKNYILLEENLCNKNDG